MPRKPEEVYAEIAAWSLADQLQLAARIVEEAARRAQAAGAAGRAHVTPPPSSNNVKPPGGPPGAATTRPGPPAARATPPLPPTAEPRSLVIVDGSNFLGTIDGFNLATDASREELITRLQDYVHDHPSFRVVAYFDGEKTSVKRAGGVEVRFTPRGKPADFFIVEGLKSLGGAERQRALLITADRALGDEARKLGAKVEAPSSFHRRLPGVRRTAVGERGLNAAEVEAWQDYFNRPPDGGPKKR